MRRSILLSTAAVLTLLLVACGGSEDPAPTVDPVPDGQDAGPDDEVAPDDDPVAGGDDAAGSEALLGAEAQLAVTDAAERAGVARDEVLITVTELVTWPDGSIGCPQPDMTYTQALVDGYRIVVEAGGTPYTYHGQQGGDPFHCEDPQDPASVR